MRGLAALEAEAGVRPDQLTLILHGTTLATNAIIERRLAPTALVTTEGFRDVLEIGAIGEPTSTTRSSRWSARSSAATCASRSRSASAPRASRSSRLDRANAQEVVDVLRQAGVAAVAVVFLHSYRNPAHEEQMTSLLRERRTGSCAGPRSCRVSCASTSGPRRRC